MVQGYAFCEGLSNTGPCKGELCQGVSCKGAFAHSSCDSLLWTFYALVNSPSACSEPSCTCNATKDKYGNVFEKIQRIMGGQFEAPPTVHWVRDVSPGKIMLCVTFRVPEAVAFNGRGESTAAKREGMAEAERKEEGIDAHCIELGTSEAKRQRT
eukprot:1138933-Pelagomonas_calceolata.AAC.8